MKKAYLLAFVSFAFTGAAWAQSYLSPQPTQQQPVVPQKPAAAPAQAPAANPAQAQKAPGAVVQPGAPIAEPAAARSDITEQLSDWYYQCGSKPQKSCQISQRLVSPANRSMLGWLEVSRISGDKPKDILAVIVPLGLRVRPEIVLMADDSVIAKPVVSTCVQMGCMYNLDITAQQLAQLAKAKGLSVELEDMAGRKLPLKFTMASFNEALKKSNTYLESKK